MIFYVVNFSNEIPTALRPVVEEKVRQVLREPPKGILQVRVDRFLVTQLQGVIAGFACRVTVLGAGEKRLSEEPEFVLFRLANKPAELHYWQFIKR